MQLHDVKSFECIEPENHRLTKIVADLTFDNDTTSRRRQRKNLTIRPSLSSGDAGEEIGVKERKVRRVVGRNGSTNVERYF